MMRKSASIYLTIISLLASITSVTAAPTYQGCYAGDSSLSGPTTYDYQSQGHCLEVCQAGGYAVFAMTNGNGCSCGNSIPSTTANSCDLACVGYPSDTCGGTTAYSVWLTGTGTLSGGSGAASAGTTRKTSTTALAAVSTATPIAPTVIYVTTAVVQQGVTIIQTVSASTQPTTTSTSSPSASGSAAAQQARTATKGGKSGLSGGAIAGIVIGVLVLAAIAAVTAFVCLRRRNRQTEEFGEYKKHIEPAGAGVTRQPSSVDNRLDTSLAIRRDSAESLADNQDYSRKILRVVN